MSNVMISTSSIPADTRVYAAIRAEKERREQEERRLELEEKQGQQWDSVLQG